MNVDLRMRILHRLKGRATQMAGDLAFALDYKIDVIRDELTHMIADGQVKRHHMPNGTLRYSITPRAERACRLDAPRQQQNPIITPQLLAELHDGIELVASDPDIGTRLRALETIGAAVGKHLEEAMAQADIARAKQGVIP